MSQTVLERQLFGYDAVDSTTRRKAPIADSRSEDAILNILGRDTLAGSALDAKRNFAIAAWMIRKHVSFVADFMFQPNTPNREWNKRAADFMKRWSRRKNCHVSKRHRLRKLIRIAEVCRTTQGDDVWELMRAGTVNVIRGDRVRNPRGAANSDDWVHGVNIDRTTEEAIGYQIHRRTRGGGFVSQKYLPAKNALHHGYFDDPEQYRGVSPLSTAINNFRDVYEGIDFTLARLKIEQLMGLIITKDRGTGNNPFQGNNQFETSAEDDDELTDEEREQAELQRQIEENKRGLVDYGKGIFQVEMNPGEDLKFVTTTNPSANAQAFWQVCIHIALKSLDIPYSFYSEDFSNFFGSRGALQLYKRSAQDKQEDNQELLDDITRWRLRKAIIDGELDLPRGWKLSELDLPWVPVGIPWWDRSKEVIGDVRACAAGFDTPQNVCLSNGDRTFEQNVDDLAEAYKYWTEKLGQYNVPFGFATIVSAGSGTGLKTDTKKTSSKDAAE